MLTEIQRLQQLAGLLNESALGAAYAERELDGDASRQMHEKELPDHEQDDYEGAIVDDFATGDWVKSKSSNVGGQVVGTNWRENSVSVKLPNGQIQKFDANELMQDPYEDDEEDHEGTWADFKGDERSFRESMFDNDDDDPRAFIKSELRQNILDLLNQAVENGISKDELEDMFEDQIDMTQGELDEEDVKVQDFEGDLDDYVAKLVSQQIKKDTPNK